MNTNVKSVIRNTCCYLNTHLQLFVVIFSRNFYSVILTLVEAFFFTLIGYLSSCTSHLFFISTLLNALVYFNFNGLWDLNNCDSNSNKTAQHSTFLWGGQRNAITCISCTFCWYLSAICNSL